MQPGQILVSTLEDEIDNDYSLGDLSLREALFIAAQTSADDTIIFSVTGTIVLDDLLGELVINTDVTIQGNGAAQLTISGNEEVRVMNVNAGVTATIADLSITAGMGVGNGGGIYNAGHLTVDTVTIYENTATNAGGGIYVASSGVLEVIDSTIDSNNASFGGGIFGHFNSGQVLTITGSTLSNNSAIAGTGGGLNFFSVAAAGPAIGTITNTTISGNQAGTSGGIRVRYSSANLTILNSTITDNHAIATGGIVGGIHNVQEASITMHNTIVAGNTSNHPTYHDVWGDISGGGTSSNNLLGIQHTSLPFSSVAHSHLTNNVNGNRVGTQTTPLNVGLTALANNGGPTKTHAVLPNSIALNGGNTSAASTLSTDQRGSARLVGGIVDIGAFEYSSIVVSTLVDENDGNYTAGNLSLREAIQLAKSSTNDDTVEFAPGLTGTINVNDPLSIDAGFLGNLSIRGNGTLTVSAASTENHVFVISKDSASTIESLTIRDLRITGATVAAITTSGSWTDIDLTLERLDISDNAGAGVVYSNGGALTVIHTTVARNEDYGIQVYAAESFLVSRTSIHDNDGVGIQISNTFDAQVKNSTISSNVSALAAGGILLSQFASVLVVNSTIVNNTGMITGGIYGANYSMVELHNSIVALNVDASGASDLALSSSWFAGTESNNIIGVDESNSFFTGNDNQFGVTAAALKLGALAYNGGPTMTHALLSGSLAIDTGSNAAASGLLYDQRGSGFDRIFNDTVDIGAVEMAFEEL